MTIMLPSPSVSLSGSFGEPCCGCVERWDSWIEIGSVRRLKVQQPSRRLPTKRWGSRGVVALAAAPVRWKLDDVERISRGRPSKAKTGSRAVPHRLNAEERKAFELAKKRGYVIQQASSRRYPLINTYRNYCDALDLLCVRIEQGTTGLTDEVVIDFTPLHLSEADLATLRAEISKEVVSVLAMDNGQALTFEEIPRVDGAGLHTEDQDDSSRLDDKEESGLPDSSTEYLNENLQLAGLEAANETLRFQAPSRKMTKVISQAALDTWRSFSSNQARN